MYEASEVDRFVRAVERVEGPLAVPMERPATISEQIGEALVRDIAGGKLGPGDRLLEVELANRFGVARGTVREALHGLDKDGLVDFTPRRGIYIHRPTAEDIREIYELRAELFALAARKACEIADDRYLKLIAEGAELLQRIGGVEAASLQDFLAVRKGIGDLVVGASGSRRLNEMLSRLSRLSIIHRRAMDNPERRKAAVKLWRDLARALSSRKAEAADLAARGLVDNAKAELLAQLK